MLRWSLLPFFVCACFVSAGAAASSPSSNEHYFAIQVNYADPDEARRVDQGLGGGLLYGFALSGHWHLETRLTALVLERDIAGGTDFYQQDLGVDLAYRFDDAGGWRPFVLFGLSAIRNDVDSGPLDQVNAAAHVGFGFVTGRLRDMDVRVRGEVRYVHDDYLEGVQDLRLGVSIEIPFGPFDDDSPRETPVTPPTAPGPQQDGDNDGVGDAIDRCPYSLAVARHDAAGCMLPGQTVRLYDISFENDTAVLTAAARAGLGEVVLALRTQPDLLIEIGGHTDASGDAARNLALSLERAEAVVTFLVLQGVSTQRLSARGYGETQPVGDNSSATGRARNRRIELRFLEPEN